MATSFQNAKTIPGLRCSSPSSLPRMSLPSPQTPPIPMLVLFCNNIPVATDNCWHFFLMRTTPKLNNRVVQFLPYKLFPLSKSLQFLNSLSFPLWHFHQHFLTPHSSFLPQTCLSPYPLFRHPASVPPITSSLAASSGLITLPDRRRFRHVNVVCAYSDLCGWEGEKKGAMGTEQED
jgi:hypothetical protein